MSDGTAAATRESALLSVQLMLSFFLTYMGLSGVLMLKKTAVIILLVILAIILFYVYDYYKLPEGVEVKSGNQETIAWVSLATSIVSLLTAVVGLVQKILEKKTS